MQTEMGAGVRPAYDAALVEARLLEAGCTLWTLFVPGLAPAGFRSGMPECLRDVMEGYGYGKVETRAAPPLAREIAEMDQALSWIRLLPPDRVVFRKIVAMRMLCRPYQERPIFSWRGIGLKVGASYEAVRVWHGQAIGMMVDALNRPGFCAAGGGLVAPGRRDIDKELRRIQGAPAPARKGRVRTRELA